MHLRPGSAFRRRQGSWRAEAATSAPCSRWIFFGKSVSARRGAHQTLALPKHSVAGPNRPGHAFHALRRRNHRVPSGDCRGLPKEGKDVAPTDGPFAVAAAKAGSSGRSGSPGGTPGFASRSTPAGAQTA